MAAHKLIVEAQLAAKRAHFVLEEFAQGFDQLHIHTLWQAAHIVMRFDRHRRPAGEADAFDHIGIERALREEIRPAQLCRLFLEYGNKFAANKFALFLWVSDTIKARHKAFLGIHHDQRDVVMIAEQFFDLFAFVKAQKPVIDENAGELIADRLMDQDCSNRAINPAR